MHFAHLDVTEFIFLTQSELNEKKPRGYIRKCLNLKRLSLKAKAKLKEGGEYCHPTLDTQKPKDQLNNQVMQMQKHAFLKECVKGKLYLIAYLTTAADVVEE